MNTVLPKNSISALASSHKGKTVSHRLSSEIESYICREFDDGKSLRAIGRALGKHHQVVKQVLRRFGRNTAVKRVAPLLAQEMWTEVVRLRKEGLGNRRIAKLLGVTKHAVMSLIRRNGGLERAPNFYGKATGDEVKRAEVLIATEYEKERRALECYDELNWWSQATHTVKYFPDIDTEAVMTGLRSFRNRVRRCSGGRVEPGRNVLDFLNRFLGCSLPEFKRHIEARFVGGMTWDNYGTFWEYDHEWMVCWGDWTKEEDWRRLMRYSNVRPMIVTENRRRKGREFQRNKV